MTMMTSTINATELNVLIEEGEYSQAAAILKEHYAAQESIPDETAFINFIQLLVLAEDFGTCIRSVASHPQFAKIATFEHAYALYRQAQYHAALALLKPLVEGGNGTPEARILTLYAQALYRINRFGECAKAYEWVFKLVDGEEKARVAVNYLAARMSHAAQTGDSIDASETLIKKYSSASYETALNWSLCQAIGGDLVEAERTCKAALTMAEKSMKAEGIIEEAMDSELAPIRVHQAYLEANTMGNSAANTFKTLLCSDGKLTGNNLAVASWNAAVLKQESVDSTMAELLLAPGNKLSPYQRSLALFNVANLKFANGDVSKAKTIVKGLLKKHPGGQLHIACCHLLFEILLQDLTKYDGEMRQVAKDNAIIKALWAAHCHDFSALKAAGAPPLILGMYADHLLQSEDEAAIEKILDDTTYALETKARILVPRIFFLLTRTRSSHDDDNNDDDAVDNTSSALRKAQAQMRTLERLYGPAMAANPIIGIVSELFEILSPQ